MGSSYTLSASSTGTAEVDIDYYLVGSFNSWSEKDSDYLFTESSDQEGIFTLEVDASSFSTDVQFKVLTSQSGWYSVGYAIEY